MSNNQLKKESFLARNAEFITLISLIIGGFYFVTSSLGHRIDRVEDRVCGLEKEVYSIKGMMSFTQKNIKGE